MRLRRNEYCPVHKSLSCCGRETLPKPRLVKLGVQRVEDPHHPRGYRELRSPAEMRKLLNRKVRQQAGICALCHEEFTDYNDIVPDMYFLILTNYMGKFGKSVLLDQDTGPAVWNQPIAGYRFLTQRPMLLLLNIGEEDIKGHEVVQAAHALLGASGLNYVGFVEGDDIFSGDVDVVVTDGFTGNVALKTMEGVAGLIADRLRQEFQASLLDRLAGLIARPVLRRAAAGLDPRRYNGACMVGLAGIVVKSHGHADGVAFARAIATDAEDGITEIQDNVAPAPEPRAVRDGNAEHLRDHHDGQRDGVVRGQVHLPALSGLIQKLARDLPDTGLEISDHPRGESL